MADLEVVPGAGDAALYAQSDIKLDVPARSQAQLTLRVLTQGDGAGGAGVAPTCWHAAHEIDRISTIKARRAIHAAALAFWRPMRYHGN